MNALIYYLIYSLYPYIWIHSQEKYYPYDIKSYVENSELWCNDTKMGDYKELNSNIIKYYQDHSHCYLKPLENIKNGYNKDLNKAPIYVYYSNFGDYFEIKYLFFYAYNGAYNILHFFNYLNFNYGEHFSDLEHITIRFKNITLKNKHNLVKLDKIYLAAHTSEEGIWLEPSEIEWNDSHPIIYSAINGHGSYPYPNTYYRIYGFANDYCNKGSLWNTSNLILLNNNSDSWSNFKGVYNYNQDVTITIKNLYSMTHGSEISETNKSTNGVKRFFYMYPGQFGYK